MIFLIILDIFLDIIKVINKVNIFYIISINIEKEIYFSIYQ